ncbi:MAG: methyltransferase [Acidimicrobiia bacterium]
MAMTTTTEVDRASGLLGGDPAPMRPPVADWLLAMGPVVHRLDYGGRVAAVGCGDPAATALLATAYPLASLDAVDPDPPAVAATLAALERAGAASRCEVDVCGPDALRPRAYDLVCVLRGLGTLPDPIAHARAALAAVRPDGAVMVVERSRTDAFDLGPVVIGGWLLEAGASRVRVAAATPHGFVIDARPDH